jgi:hypothetical protein
MKNSVFKRDKIPFENRVEFIDFQHPYAYDLDILENIHCFKTVTERPLMLVKEISKSIVDTFAK